MQRYGGTSSHSSLGEGQMHGCPSTDRSTSKSTLHDAPRILLASHCVRASRSASCAPHHHLGQEKRAPLEKTLSARLARFDIPSEISKREPRTPRVLRTRFKCSDALLLLLGSPLRICERAEYFPRGGIDHRHRLSSWASTRHLYVGILSERPRSPVGSSLGKTVSR